MNYSNESIVYIIDKKDNHLVGVMAFDSPDEAHLASQKFPEFQENHMTTASELDRYNEFMKYIRETYDINARWVGIPEQNIATMR